MSSYPTMPQGITITPCEEPPHPDCLPGPWWRYEVVTSSGRNRVNMRKRERKRKSSKAHRATTSMIFGASRGEFV